MKRLGVIGIIVENREMAMDVQKLLGDFSEIIMGRMGVPDKESGVSAISLLVKGTVEQVSALTGKLGKLNSVAVKSAMTTVEVN
ncbi:MAG: iron-only hydrogenase system regulator [Clostridia bacterium]